MVKTVNWHAKLAVVLLLIGASSVVTAQPLGKENFREYLDALENVDAEALTTRFYHEDFSIVGVDGVALDAAALIEFERTLKSLVDFRFVVDQIVADETGIAIDAVQIRTVLEDGDIPQIGPAKKGETWQLHLNVFYTLLDGKILTIKANLLSVNKVE